MILMLHSTETDKGTARPVADYLIRMGYESHWVYDPHFDEEIDLLPLRIAAKSLVNEPGGVETNRRDVDGIPGPDVLQVEIVHRAGQGEMDEWWARLRRWLKQKCAENGIPYVFPLPFPNNASTQRSMTFEEWNDPALAGIVGHCHAPENRDRHWDPGPLNMRILVPENDQPLAPAVVAPAVTKEPPDMILLALKTPEGAADVDAGVFLHSGDALRWVRNGNEYAALKRGGVPESLCTHEELDAVILELLEADQLVGPGPTSGAFKGAW